MSASDLHSCLQREAEAVTAFAQILTEEGDALLQRATPEALADITQRKMAIIDTLDQLAQERDAQLATLGFETGHSGAAAAASAHPDLAEPWEQLLAQADAARQQNEHNGVIIRAQLQYHQQAMAALRDAQARTTLYGPSGRQKPAQPTSTGRSRKA